MIPIKRGGVQKTLTHDLALQTWAPVEHLVIALSAVRALMSAHKQGYVVLDLKYDNIFFDAQTEKSTLIDGGISAQIGTVANKAYVCNSEEEVKTYRAKYHQFPPEFWSTEEVYAHPSMDVYGLGSLLSSVFNKTMCPLDQIIEECLSNEAQSRPSLMKIEEELTFFCQNCLIVILNPT